MLKPDKNNQTKKIHTNIKRKFLAEKIYIFNKKCNVLGHHFLCYNIFKIYAGLPHTQGTQGVFKL